MEGQPIRQPGEAKGTPGPVECAKELHADENDEMTR